MADFTRGYCDFCGDCSRACAPHAIAADTTQLAWDLAIHISDACLAQQNVVCRSCGESCGAGAIRFVPRVGAVSLPQLDVERCTACGECVAPCPSGAITLVSPDVLQELAA